MRKVIFLILIAIIIGTLILGCSSRNEESVKTNTDKSIDNTEEVGELNKEKNITFPLENQITFKVWAPLSLNASKTMNDLNGSRVFEELEKRTNVKIEFIHPEIGQEGEQFNLMLASSQLPDIVIGGTTYYKGGGDRAVEDGVFIALNDLIEEYAPNYYKLIANNEDAKKQTISDTGVMSAIYPILNQENPCWHGLTIRKDWLDEIGMDIPLTIDQWENMLIAFKDNHPDAIPLLFDFVGPTDIRFKNNVTDGFGLFVSAYDIGPQLYQDEGSVRFGPSEDDFKDYLELMKKWYQLGLIDRDFPVRDRAGIIAIAESGEIGAFAGSIDYANNLFGSLGLEYVAAPYPVIVEGDRLNYRAGDFVASPPAWATSITSRCEEPEIALAWLDYAFSEEGAMLFNYGIKGESYEIGDDGQPEFTDLVLNNPEYTIEECIFIYKMHIWPQLRYGAYANPASLIDSSIMDIKEKWTQASSMDMRMPPISLTAEEGKEYADIMNGLDAYRNDMVLKFITGVESLELFDTYVMQMKNMGLERAIEIQQNALDRYLAR